MTRPFRRFEENAAGYAAFRPAYPQSLIEHVSDAILAGMHAPELPAIDVGSGTGIVSRQLAAALPCDRAIVGVEPAGAMRSEAEATPDTPFNISYRDGVAEELPFARSSVCAVVAATAAHWFDRPRFYDEASRVLVPGGVIALLEYIRDVEASAGAAAMETFLRQRGGPQAYERADYVAELAGHGGFEKATLVEDRNTLPLSVEGFAGLVLSSSHARPIVATAGLDAVRDDLLSLGSRLADETGTVNVGYRFRLVTALRRP